MSSPADPLGRLNEMEAPPRVPGKQCMLKN